MAYAEVLHNAEHPPDNLLHGGGPASVTGFAPVDAHIVPDTGPAIGADEMSISTGKNLAGWSHLIKTGRTLRYLRGRRGRWGRILVCIIHLDSFVKFSFE